MGTISKGKSSIFVFLRRLLRDEKAQALTEYAVLMLVVMTLCFYLYHPDNLFYHAARSRCDLIVFMLTLPGP